MKKIGWTVVWIGAVLNSLAFSASAGKMYFTDSNNGGNAIAKVMRSDLNGSDVELLVTPAGLNPHYIALDIAGGKMYWTDISTVRSANLDGTDVNNNLVGGLSGPIGIALDLGAGKIYWTDNGTNKIQRADLNGSNIEDVITGLGDPRGLALDLTAEKIYWTDTLTDKIQRANFDGSGVEDLVTGQGFPQGIALDVPGNRMYWANDWYIWSAKLDGTDIQQLFMSNPAIGIALDLKDKKIYWTNVNDHKVQRSNFDGTSMEDLVNTGLDTPWGIALDIPTAIEVSVDLKPGSQTNTINLYSAGVIPIAILSSDTFDALSVKVETVWVSGASVRLAGKSDRYMCQEIDVNNDGLTDLVCDIETAEFMLEEGEDTVELTAETSDGIKIHGTDLIKIVP